MQDGGDDHDHDGVLDDHDHDGGPDDDHDGVLGDDHCCDLGHWPMVRITMAISMMTIPSEMRSTVNDNLDNDTIFLPGWATSNPHERPGSPPSHPTHPALARPGENWKL